MKSFNLSTVAIRSLRHFVRPNGAVGLGIAAATAVIVGALVVGDSVRGSLRGLVLDRLANVDCLLHTPTFFAPHLLSGLSEPQAQIIPLIYLPRSTVEHRIDDSVQRSSEIQIFGTDDAFWSSIAPPVDELRLGLKADEIAVSQSLARELQAAVGDELTLRFARTSGVPPDSPLGHRDDTTVNLPRQKVVAILPDIGVGGLSFASSQTVPRNIFCDVATLQDALDCGAQINAAVALSSSPSNINESNTASTNHKPNAAAGQLGAEWCLQLNDRLRPALEDYGLKLERITQRFPDSAESAVSTPSSTATDAEETDAEETDAEKTDAEKTTEGSTQGNSVPPNDDSTPTTTKTIYDYYQLTSDQLILDNATVDAMESHFDGSQSLLLAYLANTIAKVVPAGSNVVDDMRSDILSGPVSVVTRQVPYSIVVGVQDALAGLPDPSAALSPQELTYPYCWINSWLAEELQASPKDWLEISYYEPETIDGRQQQRQTRAIIAGIVPLTKPEQGYRRNRPAVYTSPPTIFNDPHLTPTVPGLTDKDSIANWNAPFKLELDLIQPADDDYYDHYRLTPKLFLPYRAAAEPSMFGSRFGQTTSVRFSVDKFSSELHLREQLEAALLINRTLKGFQFEPIREKLLKSAAGTTPFDMLFLSLSFFVIVAALMLVALLFKLGISQRATQLGLLAAQGFTPKRIRSLLLREMALVATVGAGLGIVLGLGYAWAMIAALETWWVGAISAPFLSFSFTWSSLTIGALAGLLISLATLYVSLRRISRQTPLRLLRGQSEASTNNSHAFRVGLLVVAGVLGLSALGLMVAGSGQSGMARAGSFFGSGMLLLVAGLLALHYVLQSRGGLLGGSRATTIQANSTHASGLWPLAWRTIQRNPLRSSLALGLLSVASFLIASMSVFHVAPDPRGYGGFDLIAESAQPIYQDLGSNTVRSEQLGTAAQELEHAVVVPTRMRPGQDASCNNLFQVEQPTILGIPSRLGQIADDNRDQSGLGTFQWAVKPADNWQALETPGTGTADDPIPVILDQNTAAWSLKQGASLGATTVLEYGQRELHFRTVGLLANSVLQGKLLISETNFKKLFPELSGYRFFMIKSAANTSEANTTATLEKGWSDAGLDVTSSQQTLQQLLGVQNTYISAFQSLGALGLLLGTFGLIAVQLRSVWERRRELALMQAVGFSKRRIAHLLTLETLLLLGGGLLIGSLAAAIALVPYVIENGTRLSLLGPLVMLAGILLVGFIAALVSVRAAMQKSVLSGLRAE